MSQGGYGGGMPQQPLSSLGQYGYQQPGQGAAGLPMGSASTQLRMASGQQQPLNTWGGAPQSAFAGGGYGMQQPMKSSQYSFQPARTSFGGDILGNANPSYQDNPIYGSPGGPTMGGARLAMQSPATSSFNPSALSALQQAQPAGLAPTNGPGFRSQQSQPLNTWGGAQGVPAGGMVPTKEVTRHPTAPVQQRAFESANNYGNTMQMGAAPVQQQSSPIPGYGEATSQGVPATLDPRSMGWLIGALGGGNFGYAGRDIPSQQNAYQQYYNSSYGQQAPTGGINYTPFNWDWNNGFPR